MLQESAKECFVVPSLQPSSKALAALSLFATLGTLTEAAEQLGVTRSALSHRIAELEKRLGVALVRKVGRCIALTEDGERLLSSMGDALDRIEAAVEPFRRDRGQIRLSTVATFASHWLIPRIAQFQARHPRIEVAIFTTTRPVDLKQEAMDCAIRHGRGGWKGLSSVLLFKETLMPVAAPGVADRFSSSPGRDWHRAPLIRARSRFMDWSNWQKHDRALAQR
ncbi:MAG TPA: LysR substrate-binding domain-containing protein, partial [Bradyrhizobium sp.]